MAQRRLAPWRRNPPELFLLALCLLSGVSALAGAEPPNEVQKAVAEAVPPWVVWGWAAALAAAGAVGTLGNLWPGQLVTAFRIRLSGQMIVAGAAAAYAVMVATHAPQLPQVWVVVAVWSGFSVWTARLLHADLRTVRRLP